MTNLILSALISFSSFNGPSFLQKENSFPAVQFLQVSYLIYFDIYRQSKPLLENPISEEMNPAAASFFNKGEFDQGFLMAEAGILALYMAGYSIDNSGMVSQVAMAFAGIFEVLAVASNNKLMNEKINVSANIFALAF